MNEPIEQDGTCANLGRGLCQPSVFFSKFRTRDQNHATLLAYAHYIASLSLIESGRKEITMSVAMIASASPLCVIRVVRRFDFVQYNGQCWRGGRK